MDNLYLPCSGFNCANMAYQMEELDGIKLIQITYFTTWHIKFATKNLGWGSFCDNCCNTLNCNLLNCSYLGHVIKNLLTCLRVNPDVAVLCSANFSHFSLVTCLATKLWVDLISGKGSAQVKQTRNQIWCSPKLLASLHLWSLKSSVFQIIRKING